MLNLEQIAARIVQPELCQKDELSTLKDLTEKYPYAQLFSILYLKALSVHNDIHFEDELAKHAYRITDRTQLFDLINNQKVVLNELKIDLTGTEESASEEQPEMRILRPEIEITEISVDELIQVEHAENIQEDPIEDIAPIKSVEIAVNETEIDSINILVDEMTDSNSHATELESKEKELDSFEKDMLSQALVSAYNFETEERGPSDDSTDSREPGSGSEKESGPSASSGTERIEEPEEVEREGSEVTQRSFTSWLRSNDNEIPQIDFEKARLDALVDQFIREEPSISRPGRQDQEEDKPKKEFYSAAKKAKESLDTTSMPVSETLAKIFALQGNYPKAIYAYEQLMLSNPEKKIFFASQIKELKKKLNT